MMVTEVKKMTPHAQMYTPTQVSAILQLSRTKTYQLISSGDLPSVRIGRSRRVVHDDLDSFVDRCRTAFGPT